MTKLDIAAVIAPLMTTLAVFSITVSPGPAMAAEVEAPAIAIQTSDIDFADPGAQQKLDRRIERAARKACGLNDVRTGTLLASPRSRECYRQAVRNSREQVARIEQNARRGG